MRDQLAWATLIGGLALTIVVWAIGYAVSVRELVMADTSRRLCAPRSKRVRFLGSARSGTTEAWLMHVTSLALVP